MTLLPIAEDLYFPSWFHNTTRAYLSLSDSEKFSFDALLDQKTAESEYIWENHAAEILMKLRQSSDMLVCAEDLGVVPRCVPRVLNQLSILSLKVLPWTREYKEEGEPYIPFDDYPEDSVCTTSVHDAVTFRHWLKDSSGDKTTAEFLDLPVNGNWAKPEIITGLLKTIMKTSSRIVILPLQDILSAGKKWTESDPAAERINIPGTVSDSNWAFRMKDTVEKLKTDNSINNIIDSILENRE